MVAMTFFVRTLVLITIAVLLPTMTNSAPAHNQRHKHAPWHNPCNTKNNGGGKITLAVKREQYVKVYNHLGKLKFHLKSMNHAIQTENVSIWFESQNKSFTDLAQVGKMKNINNPYNLLHIYVQKYIGYFHYLHKEQRSAENLSNEGSGKIAQLEETMNYAKTLLCEIETALNITTNIKIRYLTHAEMHKIIAKTGSKSATLNVKEMIAVTRFADFVQDVFHLMKPKAEKFELMTSGEKSGERKNLGRRRKMPLKQNQKKVVGGKKNLRKGLVKKVVKG